MRQDRPTAARSLRAPTKPEVCISLHNHSETRCAKRNVCSGTRNCLRSRSLDSSMDHHPLLRLPTEICCRQSTHTQELRCQQTIHACGKYHQQQRQCNGAPHKRRTLGALGRGCEECFNIKRSPRVRAIDGSQPRPPAAQHTRRTTRTARRSTLILEYFNHILYTYTRTIHSHATTTRIIEAADRTPSTPCPPVSHAW